MTETGEWLECVVDNDYEIFDQNPYPIRRKGSDKVIGDYYSGNGYVQCSLNGKSYQKHRIIAIQFIPNPNNLPCIDHINHNRTDNRISNLRWCSSSDNNKNRTSSRGITHEYLETIPCENDEDIIEVRDYNEHLFDGLYYIDNYFYQWNGIQYRRIHINYSKKGLANVQIQDIDGKQVRISYSIFKKLYGLD